MTTSAKHIAQLIRTAVPPIHPEGLKFVKVIGGVTLASSIVCRSLGMRKTSKIIAKVGSVATIGTALFFRHPKRVTPAELGAIVSPADGIVSLIELATPPAELGLGNELRTRISIFLSILDVHVQRFPVAGEITQMAYVAGKFLSADLADASTVNERNSMVIDIDDNKNIIVTQIAGLVARRILCDASPGDTAVLGETYGLIRFGSRVDTYLPVGIDPVVSLGQRAIGGETILAKLPTEAHA